MAQDTKGFVQEGLDTCMAALVELVRLEPDSEEELWGIALLYVARFGESIMWLHEMSILAKANGKSLRDYVDEQVKKQFGVDKDAPLDMAAFEKAFGKIKADKSNLN